ncbi:MAG: YbbR-like domain-containing protein [Oscillospiraceae bacterium]|jgi:YbbR domain-containing protein
MAQENKKSLFDRKWFTILISFVIAFVCWLIVSYSISNTLSIEVDNVPVTISSTSYTNYGLLIADYDPQEVTVTISGERNVVGDVTSEDIVVTPSIGGITSAGTYEVNLTATKKDSLDSYTIVSISPSTITMKFDVSQSKVMEVETYITGISVPDGYITGTITTDPETVTIGGPEEEVNKIASVVARGELTGVQSETVTISCDLVFLDSDGNELTLENVSTDVTSVEVTVPVLKRAEIPVTVEFVNVPEGFNTDTLSYTLSMDTVLVAGQESVIDSLTTSVTGYIDVSELDPDEPVTFDIVLPSGLVNLTGTDTITADFSGSGLTKKVINVTDLRFENVPSGVTAEFSQSSIQNVTVVGPSDVLDGLSAKSVVGIVDFNDFNATNGTSTVAVDFIIPSVDSAWVLGSYTVMISVDTGS